MLSPAPFRERWTIGCLVAMSVRTSALGTDFLNRIKSQHSALLRTWKSWQHKIGKNSQKKPSNVFLLVRPSRAPSLMASNETWSLSPRTNLPIEESVKTEDPRLGFSSVLVHEFSSPVCTRYPERDLEFSLFRRGKCSFKAHFHNLSSPIFVSIVLYLRHE